MENKELVRRTIEKTIACGTKTPGIFQIPKALQLKAELESCNSIPEVCLKLMRNKEDICSIFGLRDIQVISCVRELTELIAKSN